MRTTLATLTRVAISGMLLLAACASPVPPTPPKVSNVTAIAAPTATPTPAPKVATVEGPDEVTGKFEYSNPIITTYYTEHAVALVDLYGFVKRDLNWEIPIQSQTLGYLKINAQDQTGEYWLQLPRRPDGTWVDVDNDGQADQGVQVFAVAYWPNLTGGPFSEGDDPSRGWPNYLASVKIDTENKDEVTGGKLVVWAPDDQQHFPTGFGADGLLFTPDDLVGLIPAGYSIVDLDQKPFALSQARQPELELYEPKDVAIKDFSALSYTEAFEALFEKISTEWAFNGVKKVDWQALHDAIAPRVAEAEKTKDGLAYYQALHDFILSIPDGHTGLDGGEFLGQDFEQKTAGGYGFAIRELDSGRVIVVFVMPGGPAEKAGMKVGAEVTEFSGEPIGQAIGKVQPYAGPFSLESSKRYQQARYLLRGPLDAEASLTFINPSGKPQTITLTAVAERDSFAFTSIHKGEDPNALPVEYELLDSGIGYIKINSNYDDLGLIIRLFQRALAVFQANGLKNLIIDMRHNSGGAPLGLAGFLYDKEIVMGQLEYYSDKTGQFEPEGLPDKVYPNQEQYKFDKIALLVGQACASACEIESYGFAKIPGAMVVGMYPTAGVEAEVARGQFRLPQGMSGQFPTGRFVNPDGSIFLEGTGVVPTVRVPINEATALSAQDVELQAAEDAIFGVGAEDIKIEGGPVLGSPASSEAALNASTKLLEDVAKEKYSPSELSQAGHTYTYTVALENDQRLIWLNGWCATSQEILADNDQHIQLEFSVNGKAIDQKKLAVLERQFGNQFCKFYYAVVYHWPAGTTELQVKVTFEAKINDGTSDYPRGTHTYKYLVSAP